MKNTLKNLGIVIGAIVILLAILYGYSQYFLGSPTDSLTSQTISNDFPGKEVESQLDRMKSLNLNQGTALFADPAYESLHDTSIVLGQEAVGRINPFAPVTNPVVAPIQKATSSKIKK